MQKVRVNTSACIYQLLQLKHVLEILVNYANLKKHLQNTLSTSHLDVYYVKAAICPLSTHLLGGSMDTATPLIWSVISMY